MIEFKDKTDIIAELDSLKERIVSGEVTGLLIAFENSDDTKGVYITGCNDSRKWVGTLFELMVVRVSHGYWPDG